MLTVAEASGIIAAGLMVVQYALPAALVIILVSLIGTENTAATWSSVNRTISTTIWPILLQADTIGFRHRSLVAVVLTWTMTAGAALLILASVVTPLGLRDEILPAVPGPVMFQYVKDPGAWGRITPPRPDANFDRQCEFGRRINCPGQYQGVDMVEVSPGRIQSVQRDPSSIINTTIPQNLTEIFTSATSAPGSTLSGLLDIQYRRFTMKSSELINAGKAHTTGDFRFVETLLIESDIHLREGLVIDTRDASPGIGFRNHTVPADVPLGATWTEDLTWLEPVTRCVDTNLTIEQRPRDSDRQMRPDLFLIDRGAFRELDEKVLQSRIWGDNQTLDLHGRAHKAARMYNVLIAKYMNLTLPRQDQMAPQNMSDPEVASDFNTFLASDFDRVDISDIHGLEDSLGLRYERVNVSVPQDFGFRDAEGFRLLFASNFTAIQEICQGLYEVGLPGLDNRASNITNPGVACGLLLGAGLDSGQETQPDLPLPDEEITMQKSIYICASAVRASIKTVDFRYNGTGVQLSNLRVERISDKVYRNVESKPLWGVETSAPFAMRYDPLWGLVSDRYATAPGIHTLRSEHLWLPETVNHRNLFGSKSGIGATAAASGPVMNLHNTYEQAMALGSTDSLTGAWSYPIVERYRRLSENETTASQIPSLMLTDTLASLLVGTKSAIRTRPVTYPARLRIEDPPAGLPAAGIAVYRRVIRYDIRYAVPALLVLGLLAAVMGWVALILVVARLDVLRRLRDLYNQTSTGRLATVLLKEGSGNPKESTSEWVEGDGRLMLAFGRIGSKDSGYFVRVQRDGEGGRPFLKPEGHDGYAYEGARSPDGKGMGDTVVPL